MCEAASNLESAVALRRCPHTSGSVPGVGSQRVSGLGDPQEQGGPVSIYRTLRPQLCPNHPPSEPRRLETGSPFQAGCQGGFLKESDHFEILPGHRVLKLAVRDPHPPARALGHFTRTQTSEGPLEHEDQDKQIGKGSMPWSPCAEQNNVP